MALYESLTCDELREILMDATIGRPSRLTTPDAVAYRKHADEFVADAKRKGLEVEIPWDYDGMDKPEDSGENGGTA